MWKLVALVAIATLIQWVSSQEIWKSIKATVEPSKGRIIGGEEAEPHSIPWQVLLHINGNAYCGGALISQNYVLTAGHCGIVIQRVDVILGIHNKSDTSESTRLVIAGQKIIMHEEYDNTLYHNDITLIELAQPAPLNENIKIVPLPPRSDLERNYEGEAATVSGWGLYQDVPWPSTSDMSDVLLKLDVAVSNFTECVEYYNDEDGDYVLNTNLCTSGYRNRGTCDGDSGGPLTLDGVLIGLTSFGTTQCELCSPSVYTRVVNYLDWISFNSDLDV